MLGGFLRGGSSYTLQHALQCRAVACSDSFPALALLIFDSAPLVGFVDASCCTDGIREQELPEVALILVCQPVHGSTYCATYTTEYALECTAEPTASKAV